MSIIGYMNAIIKFIKFSSFNKKNSLYWHWGFNTLAHSPLHRLLLWSTFGLLPQQQWPVAERDLMLGPSACSCGAVLPRPPPLPPSSPLSLFPRFHCHSLPQGCHPPAPKEFNVQLKDLSSSVCTCQIVIYLLFILCSPPEFQRLPKSRNLVQHFHFNVEINRLFLLLTKL